MVCISLRYLEFKTVESQKQLCHKLEDNSHNAKQYQLIAKKSQVCK